MLMVVLLPYIFWIVKHCSWFWKHHFRVWWSQMQISPRPCGKLYLLQGLKIHVFVGDHIALSSKRNHEMIIPVVIPVFIVFCLNLSILMDTCMCGNGNKLITRASAIIVFTGDPTVDPVGPGRAVQCAYANGSQIKMTFNSQEQTIPSLNSKKTSGDNFKWPK